jgi:hypothetical protein
VVEHATQKIGNQPCQAVVAGLEGQGGAARARGAGAFLLRADELKAVDDLLKLGVLLVYFGMPDQGLHDGAPQGERRILFLDGHRLVWRCLAICLP